MYDIFSLSKNQINAHLLNVHQKHWDSSEENIQVSALWDLRIFCDVFTVRTLPLPLIISGRQEQRRMFINLEKGPQSIPEGSLGEGEDVGARGPIVEGYKPSLIV